MSIPAATAQRGLFAGAALGALAAGRQRRTLKFTHTNILAADGNFFW
jgi:hypothetical protein